jgi:hypothetical protein
MPPAEAIAIVFALSAITQHSDAMKEKNKVFLMLLFSSNNARAPLYRITQLVVVPA